MTPRSIRYAALLAILMVVIPSSPAGAVRVPAAAQGSSATGVTGGALFGGTLSLVGEQGNLGRKLAIVRMYYNLGESFSIPRARQVMSAGSTLLASLDVTPPSRGPSYASIASGRHDRQILAWLSQAEHDAVVYHLPAVYVSFEHEANDPAKRALGTPAQFAAAWRHIHALAAGAHLNWNTGGRLRWALILEHLAYFPVAQRPHWSLKLGMASAYWPGTRYVDVVAADGYNRGGCRSHRITRRPTAPSVSPGSLFNPVLAFARAHGGRPVFLAEWASAFYPAVPAWQAHYIDQMKSYVLANPRIEAALYWNNRGAFGCRFSIADDHLSVTALAGVGRALHGRVTG